jgi:hypothetical protein
MREIADAAAEEADFTPKRIVKKASFLSEENDK